MHDNQERSPQTYPITLMERIIVHSSQKSQKGEGKNNCQQPLRLRIVQ